MKEPPDPRVALIGASIKSERKRRPKLSQEELAQTAGVTLRHYQRIESGTENPRATTLLKIADALGVPVSLLLGESSSEQSSGKS
jgi:transcriptional regulator with XRE-family HTH domain